MVNAYCELPTAPKPFDATQLVEGHGCKQHLGAVGIGKRPCQETPVLPVIKQMRSDLDPAEDLGVRDRHEEGRDDIAKDQ